MNKSKRTVLETTVESLFEVTTADEAYQLVDTALPPPHHSNKDARIVWQYRAEGIRRQIMGSFLAEKAAARTTEQLWRHLDAGGTSAIPTVAPPDQPHSSSLWNFIQSMHHWFTDQATATLQDTTDKNTQAVVVAAKRRLPQYIQAEDDWVALKKRHDCTFTWQQLSPDSSLTTAYTANIGDIVPNQFLIIGHEAPGAASTPAKRAYDRLPFVTSFASTSTPVSKPVIRPFITHFDTNDEHTTPIKALYSAWESDPTPEHAAAFLALANNTHVQQNLATIQAFPGAGADGRAVNPGKCHIDPRFVKEEAFPISPRALLRRLGHEALAATAHLNPAALVSGIGFSVAEQTLYRNWPTN